MTRAELTALLDDYAYEVALAQAPLARFETGRKAAARAKLDRALDRLFDLPRPTPLPT